MKSLKERALSGEVLAGTWLNLASSITAEIASKSGLDWLLIDREHGAGDEETLLHQLQAIDTAASCAVVRIPHNEERLFKQALDLGAAGVMVPYVNNAEEARSAVASMRYPPQGVRGVARFTRAAGFSIDFDSYFAEANAKLLTIVQIETVEAVAQAEEIAQVEGVDVLFVGPLDLSVNLGIPQQTNHPDFLAAIRKVIAAARAAGKVAGTLLGNADQIAPAIAEGYTFLAVGSDGGMVANGMKSLKASFDTHRKSGRELQRQRALDDPAQGL